MHLILITTSTIILSIAVSASLPQSLVSHDIMPFINAESIQNLAGADDAIEAIHESKYGWYWQFFTEMRDKVLHKNCSSVEYDDLISFLNLYHINADIMKFLKVQLRANPGHVFKLLSGSIKV